MVRRQWSSQDGRGAPRQGKLGGSTRTGVAHAASAMAPGWSRRSDRPKLTTIPAAPDRRQFCDPRVQGELSAAIELRRGFPGITAKLDKLKALVVTHYGRPLT